MFGAAETDPARTERVRQLRLIGQVGVRTDAERALFVGPFEQPVEALIDVRRLGLHLAREHLQDLARLGGDLSDLDFTRQTVEREPVAFAQRLATELDGLLLLADLQFAGTDNRRLAHLASDHRGV